MYREFKAPTILETRPHRVYLCLLLLLSIAFVAGAAWGADPDLRQALEDRLAQSQHDVDGWRKSASWELTATILIAITGLVIAVIQTSKKSWIKGMTAILGFISGALVVVNQQYFDADHRAYRSLAKQGQQQINDFRMQLIQFSGPLSKEDFKDLSSQLKKLETDLGDAERAIFGKNPVPPVKGSTNAPSFSLITSAYASEGTNGMPDWAKTVPTDRGNIYFVGIANDKTAAGARDSAREQAKASTESSFAAALTSFPQIPSADATKLARDISTSGEVVSTFVSPVSGTYRGYALFRLPRTATASTAKTYFLAHSVPFDEALLNQIAAGDKAKQAAATGVEKQKKAVEKGVAYIHIATPTDVLIATILRKSVGEVVSAPKVEVQISQPADTVRYFNSGDVNLATKVKDVAAKTLAAEGYSVPLQLSDESTKGFKTKYPHQVELWLAPLPRVRPRVHLQVESGSSTEQVEQLQQNLAAAGYDVVKSETVEGIPSQEASVLYYKQSDADEANSLTKALSDLGLLNSRDTASLAQEPADSGPRHYDLRVGKDSFRQNSSP
jgi:nucleotide-binding universal stress UspA family protein